LISKPRAKSGKQDVSVISVAYFELIQVFHLPTKLLEQHFVLPCAPQLVAFIHIVAQPSQGILVTQKREGHVTIYQVFFGGTRSPNCLLWAEKKGSGLFVSKSAAWL
jgi:hypothetical protein